MSTPISTVNGPLLIAVQEQIGTPATTGYKSFKRVSGKVATQKTIEQADWLDNSRYSNAVDYVDSIQVAGQFEIQGDAGSLGFLLANTLGDDVITGSGPYQHVISPSHDVPYLSIVCELGYQNGQIMRHSDCQIVQLEIEGSADNKVLTATVEIVGMTPGEKLAALPTPTTTHEDPLLHYNAEDSFVIAEIKDGDPVKVVNQAKYTFVNGVNPYFGDSVTPVALVTGRGSQNVDPTLLADTDTVPLLNYFYYNNPEPSPGDKPTADVYYGPFNSNYSRGEDETARGVQFDYPKVGYVIDEYPEAAASGDPIEIAAIGNVRIPDGGTIEDMVTITVTSADNKNYVTNESPDPSPGS